MCKKIKLILIFTCLCIGGAFSQNDSVIITEEDAPIKEGKKDILLKYFQKDKEEIKHLWKFDLFEWGKIHPSVSFEQKLTKNFTAEAGFTLRDIGGGHAIDNYKMRYMTESFLSFKYYYNLNRRLKKGKNINGFSGNYFSLNFITYLNSVWDDGYCGSSKSEVVNEFNVNTNYGSVTLSKFDKEYSLLIAGHISNGYFHEVRLGYGIQRRIGRIGYIDGNFGCGLGYSELVNHYYIHPGVKIKAGFAVPSLRSKKTKKMKF